jgi:hypothetical protein
MLCHAKPDFLSFLSALHNLVCENLFVYLRKNSVASQVKGPNFQVRSGHYAWLVFLQMYG